MRHRAGGVSPRSALGLSALAITSLSLLAAAQLSGWPVNHDNAEYLHIGRLLLAGAVPFVDYVDTNPPLVHYLHVVPAAMDATLGMGLPQSFLLLISALCLYSGFALAGLLSGLGLLRPEWRFVLGAIWLCFSLLVLCNNGYGQREHLFALAYGPWLVCRHTRVSAPH